MVKIEKYDDLGQGITKLNNKICFVKRGIPGEDVEVEITKEKKNYTEGKIKQIIKKSKERVEPICPFYSECGGCDFLHVYESEEKRYKIERCINYFGKIDNFYNTEDNYRNKITLHFKDNKIGFYKEKSHIIVEIDSCYLVNDKMNRIVYLLKKYLKNEDDGSIIIRCNNNLEIIVVIKGSYYNINKIKNEVIIDNLIYNDNLIKGNNYFIENIKQFKFKVHYNSFFQVNRKGLEYIFLILKDFFKDKKISTVLDLYSGTSVLGIFCANYVDKVISVETNRNATDNAKDNIKLNNINNLEIINGKVEDYIDNFSNIDLIIIDPARKGLDNKTIKHLNIIKAKYIIYISCNIHSLKRDLKMLDNYDINKIEIVDMFKRTKEVESIVLLKLK